MQWPAGETPRAEFSEMCSIVILFRPGPDWPVLIGANRDEMQDRPWRAPGRHRAGRPAAGGGGAPPACRVGARAGRPAGVAGAALVPRGSGPGINGRGVVAAVSNRMNALGPSEGFRS